MENDAIYYKANELVDLLKNTPLVKEVKESEHIMLNDPKVVVLLSNYQIAQDEYNDAIRLSLDLSPFQKKLSQTKEVLYTHPLVANYLNKLKSANKYLKEIQAIIFDDVLFDK